MRKLINQIIKKDFFIILMTVIKKIYLQQLTYFVSKVFIVYYETVMFN